MNSKNRKIIILGIGILLIIILILIGKILDLQQDYDQTTQLKDSYKNEAKQLQTQAALMPTSSPTPKATLAPIPTRHMTPTPTPIRVWTTKKSNLTIKPTPTSALQPTPTMVPVKIYIAPTRAIITKTPFISPHAPTPEPKYVVTYIPGKGWCYEIRTYENGTKKTMPRIERVTLTNIYGVEQLYEITCKLINGKEHCGSSPAMNKKTWNAYKPYHESIQKWTKRPGCNGL